MAPTPSPAGWMSSAQEGTQAPLVRSLELALLETVSCPVEGEPYGVLCRALNVGGRRPLRPGPQGHPTTADPAGSRKSGLHHRAAARTGTVPGLAAHSTRWAQTPRFPLALLHHKRNHCPPSCSSPKSRAHPPPPLSCSPNLQPVSTAPTGPALRTSPQATPRGIDREAPGPCSPRLTTPLRRPPRHPRAGQPRMA